MNNSDEVRCKEIRKKIFITGYKGGMAHLASCFSAVEILYTLYLKGVLKYDPADPFMKGRDRFVLSKGHAGLALFTMLSEAGFFDVSELDSYLDTNGRIGGEPNYRDLPGIEASTGSLGHGLSLAVGMALAQKLDGSIAKTYVLLGDGESQEGSVWEAAMSAKAQGLDNLVVILDCNEIQKTNRVEETIGLVNWYDKWRSFGWKVLEVDGHDIDAVTDVLTGIEPDGSPVVVIAHTVKGKGVSIMENNPIWHYRIPNNKEKKFFLEELGIYEKELEL